MSAYDFVFLGSSPNALSAASRLSRAGRRVLVLEPRSSLGGPVTTEEFAPGFFADTGVMSAALDPEIARDLGVAVDVIRRDCVTSLSESPVSLHALPELPSAVASAVELLRAIYRTDPPLVPAATETDAAALRELGARLLGLGAREMHEVLRLLFMSARDYFDEVGGLSGPVKALLCGAAARGLSEGPFAPGTLFNFLHHEATYDGLLRCTAKGGLRSLVEALAASARLNGASIRAGAMSDGPISVVIEDGAARGVKLGSGEFIEADAVISDFDARHTFTRLAPAYELSPEMNRAVRNLRYRGSVARVHLALRALPQFSGVGADALSGTLVVAPDVAYLEKAWDQAKRGALPERPYIEATVPTASDPSLSPEGRHVLSAWVQYVPHEKCDAGSLLKTVVDSLAPFAKGLPELVLHSHVSLPGELGRRFELTEGHIYGGELRLAQAFFLRPIPGCGHYESPITNLYLAGSAAHPGGYSGRSGWNFAGGRLAAAAPRL